MVVLSNKGIHEVECLARFFMTISIAAIEHVSHFLLSRLSQQAVCLCLNDLDGKLTDQNRSNQRRPMVKLVE